MKLSPTGFNYPLDTHKINQPCWRRLCTSPSSESPEYFICRNVSLNVRMISLLLEMSEIQLAHLLFSEREF